MKMWEQHTGHGKDGPMGMASVTRVGEGDGLPAGPPYKRVMPTPPDKEP